MNTISYRKLNHVINITTINSIYTFQYDIGRAWHTLAMRKTISPLTHRSVSTLYPQMTPLSNLIGIKGYACMGIQYKRGHKQHQPRGVLIRYSLLFKHGNKMSNQSRAHTFAHTLIYAYQYERTGSKNHHYKDIQWPPRHHEPCAWRRALNWW